MPKIGFAKQRTEPTASALPQIVEAMPDTCGMVARTRTLAFRSGEVSRVSQDSLPIGTAPDLE
jgi:hypothetical protein